MNTAAIVGVGLIGGSFALALRASGFTGKIIGVSSPDAIRAALDHHIIDEALPLAEAAALADLIYLSRPIEGILSVLDELDQYVKPGALITDAGSTKSAICARASAKIHRGRFIGGHPMAGKESRGASEADATLFRGRPYILTSSSPELEHFIASFGARVVILPAEEHDRLVALTSHLPQLISTALAASLATEPDAARVAGPAAMDLTRLALSPYEIWRDIFATNAPNIDAALSLFIAKLEHLRSALRSPQIEHEFETASAAAQRLRIRDT
jgi:prephenate dehydrogenase